MKNIKNFNSFIINEYNKSDYSNEVNIALEYMDYLENIGGISSDAYEQCLPDIKSIDFSRKNEKEIKMEVLEFLFSKGYLPIPHHK